MALYTYPQTYMNSLLTDARSCEIIVPAFSSRCRRSDTFVLTPMLTKYSLFKTKQPKQFDFTPRHYDERKERIQKLEEKYRKEMKRDDGDPERRARMKEDMRVQWDRGHVNRQTGYAGLRFLIIMIVLAGALIFVYNQLDGRF